MTSGYLGIALSMIWSTFRKRDTSSQSVSFIDQGREGRIIYTGHNKSCSFYYEFGGEDVLVNIVVPEPQTWFKQTGISIVYREDVLKHIAREAIRLKNGGRGRFEIHECCILICC